MILLVAMLALNPAPVTGSPGQGIAQASFAEPELLELRCRGGSLLRFGERGPSAEHPDGLRMSLVFGAGRRPAGPDGRDLDPGTCAWLDRAFDTMDPPQIWYVQLPGQAVPQEALRDPNVYWQFNVVNTGRGHFEARWQIGPLMPLESPEPGPDDWSNLPHIILGDDAASERPGPVSSAPLFVWILAVWFGLAMVGRFTYVWAMGRPWRRFARVYPAPPHREGTRFLCGFLKVGRTAYRYTARLTADYFHLHVSTTFLVRFGHPSFSVPWSDITLSRKRIRWGLARFDTIRFTFAAAPDVEFLVRTHIAERVIAASEGRLQSPDEEPVAPAGTDHPRW